MACVLGVSFPSAQAGIQRGAAQANQNKWNAKRPWGKTERSGPLEAQRKDPFKLFDNVYYVGLQTVSAYLVTTSEGPVLIDAGYAQTADWLVDSIKKAGFDPATIKYVFVTHAHLDHAGGAARIKQLSGARVGLSAEDWEVVERQQANPQQQQNFPKLARDLVLKDGETVTVGDMPFTFYLTPGHTPGAMSVEFEAIDRGHPYRVIEPGGLGLQYAPEWGPAFKQSIERLKRLGPWDVALGNHPFLGPKDIAEIESELPKRDVVHAAVVGSAAINRFFDEVLAIVNEKLVVEPPPAAASASAGRAAQQPGADDRDVQVLQVAPTVYMIAGGGSNITLQVEPATRPQRVPGTYLGAYGVLLVDTLTSDLSGRVLAAVRRISQGPIRYIINTAIDADHIGGNEGLGTPAPGRGGRGGASPATILAHENMLLQLASPPAGQSKLPQGAMPTDAYLDVKEIWFNGESIQVLHQPAAHTDGDSIVYFRRSDVISAGDIFTTTSYPRIDSARGGTIQGVINGLNHILDLAVPETNGEGGTKIVPAHGRLSDEGDVVEYRNMAVMIRDRIQDMVKRGMTLAQVKAARPTLDYDFRYGATTGAWTTDRFIETVYNELKAAVPAKPATTPRNRS